MSIEFKELIIWADTVQTERDPNYIDKWLVKQDNNNAAADKLATFLAKSYIEGSIEFDIANTLLNQTMPVIGFDEAPEIFWRFYSAFEDYELIDRPDTKAKVRIRKELSELNEI